MGIITLVSGGLDSTLVSFLIQEEGEKQYPLFINYGQLAAKKEWDTCQAVYKKYSLPKPVKMDLSGFGSLVKSGLTNPKMDIINDAFLPGRNLLFLLAAAGYACEKKADKIAVGLLNEETHLFPDQTKMFLEQAQKFLSEVVMRELNIVTPLMTFSKQDVVALAESKGIKNTYSCHAGDEEPCGKCIACLEYEF